MSTRRGTRNTKRGDSIGAPAGPVCSRRLDARVTVLAIEQALAELGIHARLSDVVAKAESIEIEIIKAHLRRKPEQMC